jgi:putative transposase
MRRPAQTELRFPERGGRRKGAGRRPNVPGHPGVSHKTRPRFSRAAPIHVTMRMAKGVFNLRSRRSFRVIERALYHAANRFGVRVVQFSVQGNHVHFLVEASDKAALASAMKGLAVRIARRMNRMMGRKGQVIGDRYHARLLRTPTEVKVVIHYIRHNHRQHMAQLGQTLAAAWIDPYSSDSPTLTITLPAPQTWLVQRGWCRGAT